MISCVSLRINFYITSLSRGKSILLTQPRPQSAQVERLVPYQIGQAFTLGSVTALSINHTDARPIFCCCLEMRCQPRSLMQRTPPCAAGRIPFSQRSKRISRPIVTRFQPDRICKTEMKTVEQVDAVRHVMVAVADAEVGLLAEPTQEAERTQRTNRSGARPGRAMGGCELCATRCAVHLLSPIQAPSLSSPHRSFPCRRQAASGALRAVVRDHAALHAALWAVAQPACPQVTCLIQQRRGNFTAQVKTDRDGTDEDGDWKSAVHEGWNARMHVLYGDSLRDAKVSLGA